MKDSRLSADTERQWIKTSERAPTKEDATLDQDALVLTWRRNPNRAFLGEFMTRHFSAVFDEELYPVWMKIPPIDSARGVTSGEVETDCPIVAGSLEEELLVTNHPISDPLIPSHSGKETPVAQAGGESLGQSESLTWPSVLRFAQAMEAKLSQNRHKGDREGWLKCDPHWLLGRLREEAGELQIALNQGIIRIEEYKNHKWAAERVTSEAADIANFSMMLSDLFESRAATIDGALNTSVEGDKDL